MSGLLARVVQQATNDGFPSSWIVVRKHFFNYTKVKFTAPDGSTFQSVTKAREHLAKLDADKDKEEEIQMEERSSRKRNGLAGSQPRIITPSMSPKKTNTRKKTEREEQRRRRGTPSQKSKTS